MYRGLLFDSTGRISSVVEQSVPLPLPVPADLDASMYCSNSNGDLALKTEGAFSSFPVIDDGVAVVYVGQSLVVDGLPPGTHVFSGSAPIAVFESVDDFAFSADMAGDYPLVIDCPRHLPFSFVVRVVPEPSAELEIS